MTATPTPEPVAGCPATRACRPPAGRSRPAAGAPTRPPKARLLATALMTAALAAAPAGPCRADGAGEATVVLGCPIEYEEDATVGSPINGVLRECLVEPGDRVKAGQVLGRLLDDDVRAEVRRREAVAASDIEVRLMAARNALSEGKMQRSASLLRRGAMSQEEYTQHRLEAAASALELEQAKHRHRVAAFEAEEARAVLRSRELVSPIDGVVVAVGKRRGEAVAARDPVFQVVGTDRLRVVCQVDVTDVWRLAVGQSARVIPEIAGADLPVEHEVFAGRLAFVDSQVDPLTRTCKVHVRAENRGGLLRAGLEARVEIDPVIHAAAPRRTAGR